MILNMKKSKNVNRNTMGNIKMKMKMKRIRFNESTDDVAELRKYLDDFADATIEASKKDFKDMKLNSHINLAMSKIIDYIRGIGHRYDIVESMRLDNVYYAAAEFATHPTEDFRKKLEKSKIRFLNSFE